MSINRVLLPRVGPVTVIVSHALPFLGVGVKCFRIRNIALLPYSLKARMYMQVKQYWALVAISGGIFKYKNRCTPNHRWLQDIPHPRNLEELIRKLEADYLKHPPSADVINGGKVQVTWKRLLPPWVHAFLWVYMHLLCQPSLFWNFLGGKTQ